MKNEHMPVVCLLGKVNAGKSNLFNSLANKELSSVSNYAGHTKTFIFTKLFDTLNLVDTPGILDLDQEISNNTIDYIEKNADIVILVINAAEGPTKELYETYINFKNQEIKFIFVATRIDLLEQFERDVLEKQCQDLFNSKIYLVSAKENIGIFPLKNELLNLAKEIKVSAKTSESIVSDVLVGGIASSIAIGVAGMIVKSIFKRI